MEDAKDGTPLQEAAWRNNRSVCVHVACSGETVAFQSERGALWIRGGGGGGFRPKGFCPKLAQKYFWSDLISDLEDFSVGCGWV